MATGFVIGLFGDIISQITAGIQFSELDIKRLLVFSSWGGFGFTPIAYKWYNIIEATIPATIAMRGVWKMAMDQILFPPVITAFTFFMLTMIEGVLSGFSLTLNKGLQQTAVVQQSLSQLVDKAVAKVKHDLVPTLITNYKVWPAVQILNFSIVPVKLQVLFVNCVAVWWNFVLSMTQHS
ncbi:hypothetical protein GUITHDRAFT_97867 [Guillardia theta CCMP2712]|uniref:Uncharacterized protein n=2 Tax=Guillardia theta TaxID=55529 RepID=L1IGE0_GUITC|nr:hypothetical protein GUITHDRAFT_97867 [Guillardia theta CCMP2712]EKX35278.1 hypothetical protein GUITHDRAFT_97867 [Guillardia theta CCMP2712]|eukprot:XP_005822258.1 hypothetical protein GUITHDRAFT_97867 [Guillardia theta CCMP2712]